MLSASALSHIHSEGEKKVGQKGVKSMKFGKEGNAGKFKVRDKVAADNAVLTIR